MNRREKRKLQKDMGIRDHMNHLPLVERMKIVQGNIEAGNRKQQEFKDTVDRQIREQLEQRESEAIFNIAAKLSKQQKKPIIDLMEEAKNEYYKNKNS